LSERPCQLCGGVDFHSLPYYYKLGERMIHGTKCARCGLVTVTPMPTRDELKKLYSGEYFTGGDYHCGHSGSYEDEAFALEHERILGAFRELMPSGRMLEVGSAGGKLLSRARDKGYEVMGVEVSADACKIAGSLGVPHFCGELHEAQLETGSFNLAYLGDVLEHLTEPADTLEEINRVLAPGGIVGLSCPTNIGLLSSMAGLWAYEKIGKVRAAPLPPYHLYEFTAGTLVGLLAKSGFEPVRIDADIIPPWKINLRGSMVEKVMKAALHWPNWAITKLTGKMGDRITIFARKT
jgi:SAM-dependent methyltransferase